MLPEHQSGLLTAYVDGGLSEADRQKVLELLRQSAEARALLRQLQNDAELIRQLPRRTIGSDLSGAILEKINGQGIAPRRRVAPAGVHVPAWIGLGAAAAVLLVVGVSSYWYFAAAPEQPAAHSVGSGPPLVTKAPDHHEQPTEPDDVPDDPANLLNDLKPTTQPNPSPPSRPPETAPAPSQPRPKPQPAPPPNLLGSEGTVERQKLGQVERPISLLFPLRELNRERYKQELLGELRRPQAHRLDVTCRQTAEALDPLLRACGAVGLRVRVEREAREVHEARLFKDTSYALYADGVTAAEVMRILERLCREEQKAEAGPRRTGPFDSLLTNILSPEDHVLLQRLFGTDPTRSEPSRKEPRRSVDLRRPLAEDTANRLAEAAQGQGTPRPGPGQPQLKPDESVGFVMIYDPRRRRSPSPEARQFVNSRPERRSGTVPLLVILRPKS